MSGEPAPFRLWSELSQEDEFRLINLVQSLREFAAGHELSEHISSRKYSPLHGLLFSATDLFLHAYYPPSPEMGIPGVLRALRSDDLCTEIEALLERRVLRHSFRQLLTFFRKRRLAHPSFKPDALGEHFFEGTSDEYAKAQNQLALLTVTLLKSLVARYPELKSAIARIEKQQDDQDSPSSSGPGDD